MKGNYGDFFRYNVLTNTWTELKRYDSKLFINREGKKKKVKDGAGLAYLNNTVYLMKGGNTNEFWKYDIGTNNWSQMNPGEIWDIPVGNGKKVKSGGAMCLFDNSFCAVKGNNTPEFYKHASPAATLTLNPTTFESTMEQKIINSRFELTITPNPVINVSTVRYSLPTPGMVNFKLYEVSGTLVKSYTNSTLTQNGMMMIDTRTLPAGVYILKFNSGEFSTTRKLIIEK
jgi:hypothetical protein